MIRILGSIPKTVIVAVSGGADSIVVSILSEAKLPSDLRESKGRHVLVLHFDHRHRAWCRLKNFCELLL